MSRPSLLTEKDKRKIVRLLHKGGTYLVCDTYGVSTQTVYKFRKQFLSTYKPAGRCKPYLDGYFVYPDGRVWSRHIWAFMKPFVHSKGRYKGKAVIMFPNFHIPLARLVLTVFRRPPKPGEEARHYHDRDLTNNHISNLRWGTPKQNQTDRVRHGTSNRGSGNPAAKIPEKHVLILRKRYANGEKDIVDRYAKRHKITKNAVWCAATGRKWKHLPMPQ